MNSFWNIVFGIVVLLLIISGLFDYIEWKFNITAIVIVVIVWLVSMYNGFIRLVNHTKEAWADIEVQLKRRYDLIPNLVNTVKGYATHEREAFENVTRARSQAISAQTVSEHGKQENILTGAMKSLFAVAEAYPDLKANQNFLELQKELSDTENKIQAARRFYNGNVRDLNTKIDIFPNNLIASVFKFTKQEFFDLGNDEEKREVPEVKF